MSVGLEYPPRIAFASALLGHAQSSIMAIRSVRARPTGLMLRVRHLAAWRSLMSRGTFPEV